MFSATHPLVCLLVVARWLPQVGAEKRWTKYADALIRKTKSCPEVLVDFYLSSIGQRVGTRL